MFYNSAQTLSRMVTFLTNKVESFINKFFKKFVDVEEGSLSENAKKVLLVTVKFLSNKWDATKNYICNTTDEEIVITLGLIIMVFACYKIGFFNIIISYFFMAILMGLLTYMVRGVRFVCRAVVK